MCYIPPMTWLVLSGAVSLVLIVGGTWLAVKRVRALRQEREARRALVLADIALIAARGKKGRPAETEPGVRDPESGS